MILHKVCELFISMTNIRCRILWKRDDAFDLILHLSREADTYLVAKHSEAGPLGVIFENLVACLTIWSLKFI
jgi:hypothetical protein